MDTTAEPPVVTPPRVEPAAWQDHSVFRESFLLYLTEEPLNNLLRMFGRVLFDLTLSYHHKWPDWPEGVTATELRAALGDLRCLQGQLEGIGEEHHEAPCTHLETSLSIFAGRQARELARVGDEIERALQIGLATPPEPPDPTTPPPIGELFVLCEPMPWEEQREAARAWIISRWVRGAGEGNGDSALIRELRSRMKRAPSFAFAHVLTLELLALRVQAGGKRPLTVLGVESLASEILAAAGVPAGVVELYAELTR